MLHLPMSELTVVDLTRHRAGPVTSRLFADWGAKVIKIEEPTDRGDSMGGSREGFDYQNLHRNKHSLSVNLKTEDGQQIIKRLVAKADIVLENFRPEVKFRLGVDYESLKTINPRIICGSISGFGQQGPYANRPAVDQIIQGMSGIMSLTGTSDTGPLRTGVAIADVSAGMNLAIAVLMALYKREQTGIGQWVTTSLLESTLAMMDFQIARWLHDGTVPKPMGNDHPTLMPTSIIKTLDGEINIAAAEDDKFTLLCDLLEIGALHAEPEYQNIHVRALNRASLMSLIESSSRHISSNELIEKLNGKGIPCGPVYDVGQAMTNPQLDALNMKCSIMHTRLGEIALVGQPIQLGAYPKFDTVRQPAPEHGEHTQQLLIDFLAFTPNQVDSFKKNQSISTYSQQDRIRDDVI
ncbi:CaiB/BaiF CoA transferase family protein [Pseudescherichia vulneris]